MTDEFYTTAEVLKNNGKILLTSISLCLLTILLFVLSTYTPGTIIPILFLISLLYFVYYTDTRITDGIAALIGIIITILLFVIDKFIVNIPLVDRFISNIF